MRAALNAPLPKIVLIADGDHERLSAYSLAFEAAGMWVSSTTDADEAVAAAEDLRPDLIVLDEGISGPTTPANLLDRLTAPDAIHAIPTIVLAAGAAAAPARETATLVLPKPVAPDVLLAHADTILCEGPQRAAPAPRPVSLVRPDADEGARASRDCPDCGQALEWLERSRLQGIEYDYYRWCEQGCGLYCFDRASDRWIKLV